MTRVSVFYNLKTPSNTLDFSQIIKEIQSPKHRESILALRKAKAEGNETLGNDIKKRLPAFTYGATFVGGRKPEYIESFENIVGLDFDHIGDKKTIEDISSKLREDKQVFAFFVSPSGDGLKVFFKIEKIGKLDLWLKEKNYDQISIYYANRFRKVNTYAEDKYGIKGDISVKDITRLCFVSYDPNAYYNEDAESIGDINNNLLPIYEKHIKKNPKNIGNRNNTLYAFAHKAMDKGIGKEELLNFCIDKFYDLSIIEINNTILSAQNSNKGNKKKKKDKKEKNPQDNKELSNEELRDIFSERFEIRNNIVRNSFEILDKQKTEEGWKNYDEVMSNTVFSFITDTHTKARKISLDRLFKNSDIPSFDPFADKLHSLKPWDGKDYILEFAQRVKTTDSDLWASDIMKFLVSIVASVLNPKVINHYCLVLSGREGIGKSTLTKKIVPKEWMEYFTQSPLDIKHKDTNFKLSQNFLISIDELSKYTRKDIENLKELMTRDCIQERVHFGKDQQQFIRRASFCATLNDMQILSGEEGERRFWVHEVTEIDYEKEVDIDNIFAQALHLYNTCFKYWESGEEIQKRREINQKYTRPNLTQELLFTVFREPSNEISKRLSENAKYYSVSEITSSLISYFGANTKEITTQKVGKLLCKMSLEMKNTSNIRRYLLVKRDSIEMDRLKAYEYKPKEELENQEEKAFDDELPF